MADITVSPPALALTMTFPTPTLKYIYPAVLVSTMVLNVPVFRIEKISHAPRVRNRSTGKEIDTESKARMLINKSTASSSKRIN